MIIFKQEEDETKLVTIYYPPDSVIEFKSVSSIVQDEEYLIIVQGSEINYIPRGSFGYLKIGDSDE